MGEGQRTRGRLRSSAVAVILPAVPVALWAFSGGLGMLPSYVLPSPWTFARAVFGFPAGMGWQSVYAGRFWSYAAASTGRVLSGFVLASTAGVFLGALCGRWRSLNRALDPFIQLVRSVPGITWLPVAMVWFGIGTVTTVFLISLAAFFPVYVNTWIGVRNIPREWVFAARILGATPAQVIRRVVLPGTFPAIQSGLRVAAGIAWSYVVLGELTGVNRGLGAMIMDARMMGDTTAILVGMVYIALLGRLTDWLIVACSHRIRGGASMSVAALPVVEMHNVSFAYARRDSGGKTTPLPVLSRIRLEIMRGEFVCLLGPSGCGKTTLRNGANGGQSPK